MKLSDWVGKLYGFERMEEYRKTHGAIPSGGSHSGAATKNWTSFAGYNQRSPYNQFQYSEKIMLENTEVNISKNDILVVPEGKLGLVPEKYHDSTIELPNSYNFAVIR